MWTFSCPCLLNNAKETNLFPGIASLCEGCLCYLLYLLFCSSLPKDVLWLLNWLLIILVEEHPTSSRICVAMDENWKIQDNLSLAMDNLEYCVCHCLKMVKPQIKTRLARGGLVYEYRMQRKQGLGVTPAGHNLGPRLRGSKQNWQGAPWPWKCLDSLKAHQVTRVLNIKPEDNHKHLIFRLREKKIKEIKQTQWKVSKGAHCFWETLCWWWHQGLPRQRQWWWWWQWWGW